MSMMSCPSAQSSKPFSRNPSYSSDVPTCRGVQRIGEYKLPENLYGEEIILTLKTM